MGETLGSSEGEIVMVPEELSYTKEHEWIKIENGIATIGITDHAQQMLGEITFVELPEIGKEIQPGFFYLASCFPPLHVDGSQIYMSYNINNYGCCAG